jgi:hypothetical protein
VESSNTLLLNCRHQKMHAVSLIGLKHVFYLVLYIPDDDTQVVTIIRVMYGGRDVDTQLKRFTKTK